MLHAHDSASPGAAPSMWHWMGGCCRGQGHHVQEAGIYPENGSWLILGHWPRRREAAWDLRRWTVVPGRRQESKWENTVTSRQGVGLNGAQGSRGRRGRVGNTGQYWAGGQGGPGFLLPGPTDWLHTTPGQPLQWPAGLSSARPRGHGLWLRCLCLSWGHPEQAPTPAGRARGSRRDEWVRPGTEGQGEGGWP